MNSNTSNDIRRDSTLFRVLDNGYVRLEGVFGDDLKVANAARASFNRRSEKFSGKDAGLVNFLATHGHTSPFRHNMITFEVCAPMLVVRQIQRYVIGGNHSDSLGAWSEMSLRYVTRDFNFYIPRPDQWRGATADKKQGSAGVVSEQVGEQASHKLTRAIDRALDNYSWAINSGICGEQARLFLPSFSLYTTWYMTLSLQAFAWLLHERMRPDAMWETRQYAKVMYMLASDKFPVGLPSLLKSFSNVSVVDMEDENVA